MTAGPAASAAPARRLLTSYPVAQAEALAWHLHEDLRALLAGRRIEAAELLGIPPRDWRYAGGDLLELLCDDVEHLLREALAGAVHLLLHEPAAGGGSVHRALLHATYLVAHRRVPPAGSRRRGGLLDPGHLPAGEIAVLLDWECDTARERCRRLAPPSYNLCWTPLDRCHPTTLARDHEGSLGAVAAAIVPPGAPAPSAAAGHTFIDVP